MRFLTMEPGDGQVHMRRVEKVLFSSWMILMGWVGGDWDTLQLESPASYITTGILHTTDGLNFIEQYNPAKVGDWAIHFINKYEGWAGTYAGDLLHTLDGGDHWVIDVNGSFPGKFTEKLFR